MLGSLKSRLGNLEGPINMDCRRVGGRGIVFTRRGSVGDPLESAARATWC